MSRSETVAGFVAPGFEPVQEIFTAGVSRFGEGGGSFAAYVGDELVVDLWGGYAAPDRPWAEDTLTVIMSSTKGMATLSAQILYDRGQLDIEAPVTRYWPEFGQAGKGGVTIRHVLTHTSGVLGFGRQKLPVGWDGTGWEDYDAIAAGLAAVPALWPPGTQFGYHATTYGWLVGEIVRRITGQTIGRFFHDEVAVPLGLDIWIGTPPSEHHRVATLFEPPPRELPLPARPLLRSFERKMNDPATYAGQAFLAENGTNLMKQAGPLLNGRAALAAEMPFGNGTATARSLARVYALLAADGELDGIQLLSPATVKLFSEQQIAMLDQMLVQAFPPGIRWLAKVPVRRTLGYLLNPRIRGEKPRFGPNPRSYGHDGAGGQLAFCDPDRRIGFGFVRSAMSNRSTLSRQLIDAVYASAS
jgi:CubicO group peptidase (beta-lactamase class C family)